jgi:hypothetical protein
MKGISYIVHYISDKGAFKSILEMNKRPIKIYIGAVATNYKQFRKETIALSYIDNITTASLMSLSN